MCEKVNKNIRVLIVEDDQQMSQVFSAAFMRRGFKVYTASDGSGALQKFKHKDPHVVLLDVVIPKNDGHYVLKEIRKDLNAYVPVIMLTNVDVQDFTKESSLESIDAYVNKSNHGLNDIVDKAMEVLEKNRVLLH